MKSYDPKELCGNEHIPVLCPSDGGHSQLKEVWSEIKCHHFMLWGAHTCADCCSSVADPAYGRSHQIWLKTIFIELSKWHAHSQIGFCFNFSIVHTSTLQDWKLVVSSVKHSGLLCCSASACLPILPTIKKKSSCELGWIDFPEWNDLAGFAGQANRAHCHAEWRSTRISCYYMSLGKTGFI